MRLSHKFLIATFLATAAVVVPAYAEENLPGAVQAFLDNVERQTQSKLDYEDAEDDGNGNVTLTNLSLKREAKGDEPAMDIKIASLAFNGISEAGEETYLVDKADFSGMSMDVKGKEFSFTAAVPDGNIEGWYIREVGDDATVKEKLLASSSMAKKTHIGKMTFSAMGQSVSVDGLDSTWDGDPETGSGSFTAKVSNIAIPESLLAQADQSGMLKQLGYTSLSFDINADGKTTYGDKAVDYAMNLGIAGKDIATLKFGFGAAAIPLALFEEMQKAQAEARQPDFAKLMPELQNVEVNGASIRFEDASITKKILPMMAAMQGMDEKTLVASVGPMMQMGLMQLQNEAFAQQAAAAVNSFLADPKSITVTAKPAAPLKVSDFMAMNPNAPGEAITKLGITVTAND
jgi:hypothetical protein